MLTIDIGNSRIKWGVWDGEEIIRFGDFSHESNFNEQLFERCMPELTTIDAAIDKIIVSNVAGQQAEMVFKKWLSEKSDAKPVFFKTQKQCCGVTNAYANPESHGVDRWAALIAARSLGGTGVCIIDIGTAVTIDVMNAEGVHQGGMIMPGLNMMQKALLDDTSGIIFDESISEKTAEFFATNTQDAVKSGTLQLLRAGLEDVCLQAIKRYGKDIRIILTGGSAEKMLPLFLAANPTIPNLTHEPHLVLKGLHIAVRN